MEKTCNACTYWQEDETVDTGSSRRMCSHTGEFVKPHWVCPCWYSGQEAVDGNAEETTGVLRAEVSALTERVAALELQLQGLAQRVQPAILHGALFGGGSRV